VAQALNFFLYTAGAGPELKNGGMAVTAGQYGTWTPIGAEQTASGYDVAWKDPSTGQYTVWGTDSSGNYSSSPIPVAFATDVSLQSIETIFHQDLNGDGVIGLPAHASPATPGLAGANLGLATFNGTTLVLQGSPKFDGQIIGFTGDGTLASSDQIDLRGMNYNSVHSNFDSTTGILALGNDSAAMHIQFIGHYSQDNFRFADDSGGGTIIYGISTFAQPSPHANDTDTQIAGSSQIGVSATAAQDTFIFAPNLARLPLQISTPQRTQSRSTGRSLQT
jgi:serralysin